MFKYLPILNFLYAFICMWIDFSIITYLRKIKEGNLYFDVWSPFYIEILGEYNDFYNKYKEFLINKIIILICDK